MKNTLFRGLLSASALALTAFTSVGGAIAQESTATPEPQPVKLEKIKTKDVDPALWVVKDEDTTIYLFGTVHVLKPGLSWFDEAVKEAFDDSEKLVMEIVDPSAGDAQKIFGKYALAGDGTPLREKLGKDERKDYETAMKALGLPAAAFDPLDPWAAAVTVQVIAIGKNGYDPNQGAEKQLTAAAKAAGKPISALETVEGQLAIFDGLPQQDQLLFLNSSTKDIPLITEGLDTMVDAWGQGDSDRLGQIMNEGFTSPELRSALLTRRNAQWVRWIKDRMDKPGTIFMAVGAGHLSGSDSVQNLLLAYGLKAQRINY